MVKVKMGHLAGLGFRIQGLGFRGTVTRLGWSEVMVPFFGVPGVKLSGSQKKTISVTTCQMNRGD